MPLEASVWSPAFPRSMRCSSAIRSAACPLRHLPGGTACGAGQRLAAAPPTPRSRRERPTPRADPHPGVLCHITARQPPATSQSPGPGCAESMQSVFLAPSWGAGAATAAPSGHCGERRGQSTYRPEETSLLRSCPPPPASPPLQKETQQGSASPSPQLHSESSPRGRRQASVPGAASLVPLHHSATQSLWRKVWLTASQVSGDGRHPKR